MNVPGWHDVMVMATGIKLARLAKTVSLASVVSLTACKVAVINPCEVSIMAMNRIQLLPGLSIPEFFEACGTEVSCEQAFEAVRWQEGFGFLRCEGAEHFVFRDGICNVFLVFSK